MTICSSEHGKQRGKERAMRIMVEKCRYGGYNGEAEQTRQATQGNDAVRSITRGKEERPGGGGGAEG